MYQIVVWVALLLAAPLQAVTNYSCDFENQADRERWTLNPTANSNLYNQLQNKFYIGEPGNNGKGGGHGLYISDDNGANGHYTNSASWIVACDTVVLDHLTSGDYIISFDYCAMGNTISKNTDGSADGIYLLWAPADVKIFSNPGFSGIPSAYSDYIICLQPKALTDYIGRTQTWKQCEAVIPNQSCDGTPHVLAFVWANGNLMAQQPGAKIDNIAIMDTRPCDSPDNLELSIQGTTSTVSWTGNAFTYEVSAYSYTENTWYGPKYVTGTSASFTGLPMGQTDFVVRAKCEEDLYSLKSSLTKLIYYPDQMCVDYLDLEKAKCYTGTGFNSSDNFHNYTLGQPVDLGPLDERSRHTVHFDQMEYDIHTNGELKTVPDGELASVRLGNWLHGNETERIEYSFDVDTIDYPVLLLKYAPVFEADKSHTDDVQTRFKLDILIGGETIGQCGQADFNVNAAYTKQGTLKDGAEEQGWHLTPSANAHLASYDVVWKDWTTVGVNLKKKKYQNQKLTIRLTTFDCAQTAHCGYAYFTLNCSDGKFKGMKCGEINPVFEAPDGFVYRWAYASSEKYRVDGKMPEEYVLGHDQIFEAGPQDDSLYVVDCMFVQDSSCFFSLYASTLATNPIAAMKEPQIIKNCAEEKYIVKLDASPSWVQEIDHVKADTLVSKIYRIDHYEWSVEEDPNLWSDEITPSFEFPSKGGDYHINLRTTCGTCDSTIQYFLHLDSLGPTYDTLTLTLCDEIRRNGYVWAEKPDTVYKDYGMDSVVLFSETTSCDSIIYLNLTAPVREYVDTLVLPKNLPFLFRDRSYSVTMIDTVPVSATNCDTTWILNFEVYEALQAYMPDSVYFLCEDDNMLSIVYAITHGRSLRYSYAFSDGALPSITPVSEIQKKGQETLNIPFNPMPQANVYYGTLLLEDSIPDCNVTLPFTLTVNYASSVITQRWNDVLAIRNTDFNGGYTFDSVQWYMGETPIEGATEFNYYAGDGNTLRFNEPYRALLYRSDGVQLFTCPFMPTQLDKSVVNDMPTLVPLGAPLHIQGKGTARWMDILGRTEHSETYDNSTITTPASAGYYLLLLQGDEKRSTHSILCR